MVDRTVVVVLVRSASKWVKVPSSSWKTVPATPLPMVPLKRRKLDEPPQKGV